MFTGSQAHCTVPAKLPALPLESAKDAVVKDGGRGGEGGRKGGREIGTCIYRCYHVTCSKYKHFDDDFWASDVHGACSYVLVLLILAASYYYGVNRTISSRWEFKTALP